MSKKIVSNSGQAAVEYILMIAVVSSVIFSILPKVEDALLGNDGLLTKYTNQFSAVIQGGSVQGQYKTFRIRR